MKHLAFALLALLMGGTASAETLRISQFGKEKFLLYLPLYTAMEESLFAKRGIEVQLKFVGNDDQIFASVMSGEADIGLGDPVFAAIARGRGYPGVVIAEMVKKIGLTGVVRKDEPVKIVEPKLLAGRSICSLPAPSTTYTLLSAMLRDRGIVDSKIVQVPIGSQVAALSAKQCDVALDLEPGVTLAEAKGYRADFPFDQFNDTMTITGFQATEKTVQEKPELLQKAVSALQEALVLLSRDHEAALRTTRKIFPNMSDDIVRRAVDRMYALDVYPKTVYIEDASWQRTLRTRLESGELKAPQRTEETVRNQFALEAAKEFGLEAVE